MKYLSTLVLCALITPAFVFAADLNQGEDARDRTERAQQQTQPDRQMERDRDMRQQDRDMQHGVTDSGFLSTTPREGISVDNLIGSTVKTMADREDIGNVEDILVDRNGQPIALLVSMGGFLGLGEREVAVGWNKVTIVHKQDGTVRNRDRDTRPADGDLDLTPDDYIVLVDLTEDQLENAPEFARNW